MSSPITSSNKASTIDDQEAAATKAATDPYIWLEDVEAEECLDFAKAANEDSLAVLGDPKETKTYSDVLSVLESDDRIPYAGKYGVNEAGEEIIMNFWRDSDNPKGIWRRTTMASYKSKEPKWETVLDVDKLAEQDGISWVYKGPRVLPRSRDPFSCDGTINTRAMLSLSRGGSDAVHIKEFDLLEDKFVTEDPFNLPEAKTRISYKSRDVAIVGTDMGEGSLTDSGYPRQVREWVRGTKIEDAPVVFEGEKTDVAVNGWVDDQREHGGGIWEFRSRSLTFYTSKYWMRPVQYEHLLAPEDPARESVEAPGDFLAVDVQDDADIDVVGNMLVVSLRSDWEPKPDTTFPGGSVLYTDASTFLEKGKEACDYETLFVPNERTAYEYYSTTKNYLILSIMDNVKSKLQFYKIAQEGTSLEKVGEDKEALIRSCSVRAIDPFENDLLWFTVSGYTQPSTLYLADASKAESGEDYIVEELKALPHQYDASDVEVTQRTAVSKDGTEIPYFLVKKKDTVLNGKTPTLLYGYGGFEISLGPKYIASVGLAWIERGGAYAEACIRGGGEFGPKWHQAALKANRNKAYEDFIAVGKDLCASGLCKPETLAARGGSNGGLLMGNMYTMAPKEDGLMFGAIHCAVPLLDMKRYHTLLAGASWMAEYGDPDTDDWENFLNKYSAYQNIDENVAKYPPMLITTSTRDDRVHPGHARKMVKKIQDLGKDKDWPIYYYENIEGGHGGAADAKQSAFMTSLAYNFAFDVLTKNAAAM